MWKLKKILKTIIIFIIVIMLICILYSMQRVVNSEIEMSQILDESCKYFLYTIGYGSAVEGEDNVSQNIFAMIGIISIALMTTYLTLNLFWRVDDVKISKKIAIWKRRGEFYASILFFNEGNNICDLKASFISYDANGNLILKENHEYEYPLLVKKSYWKFEASLKDIFWYKSLKALTMNNIETYIYLTFSFVDTKNGQSSIKVIKYGRNDIIGLQNINEFSIEDNRLVNNTNVLSELNERLMKNVEQYDVSKLTQVENGGTINLSYNEEENCEEAKISFHKKAAKNDFVMALLLNKENFERFYTKESVFRCVLSGNEGIKYVTLEIKKEDGRKILDEKMEIKDNPTTYEYKLQKMVPNQYKDNEEEFFKDIKEICFTVFKEDMCMQNALIKIHKVEVDLESK